MENYKIWFFFSQFDKYLSSVCCIRELERQSRGQRSEGSWADRVLKAFGFIPFPLQ